MRPAQCGRHPSPDRDHEQRNQDHFETRAQQVGGAYRLGLPRLGADRQPAGAADKPEQENGCIERREATGHGEHVTVQGKHGPPDLQHTEDDEEQGVQLALRECSWTTARWMMPAPSEANPAQNLITTGQPGIPAAEEE